MRRRTLLLLLLAFALVWTGCHRRPTTGSQLQVVTSISVLQDLVQQVGGDQVKVTSLITGLENPHTYEPRASDVRAIAQAELFVKVGLGLEVWADALVANAANPDLEVVVTSAGIPVLETGSEEQPTASPASESQHTRGNPHIWMDPRNARRMAQTIRDALIRKRPEARQIFERNFQDYAAKLDALLEEAKQRMNRVGLRRVVSFPPAFPYLFRALGIEEIARIMEVPGTTPSPRHIAEVIRQMKQQHVRVIVTVPQFSDQIPRSIAEETGARIVRLTQLLGALPGTETYLDMIRYDVAQLEAAASGATKP